MKNVILINVLVVLLSACTHTILKAPCNESGSNCWPRTKINTWDNRK